eukprot:Protomagalhaensia_sp_Gyna_25__4303@NODE_3930_length_400_cov_1_628809_g3363_i0_p1_GENE_NODE_3930_length_400_cov_1_628809_g3363_i0NODE_3930_length_400_cov_1_628809_g3363_i0_p1_ORF_typecomplete_len127_score17_06Glutaredoxin/PF00462_24/1_5e09DUF836/PF05768_14/0_061Redoxin/PF08534_10/0_42Redoxin/PF08534_10/8_7e02_NODE_3930_length_400_cov_1_628809_g3363_i051383
MFMEPDDGHDPYGVSDADTILHFINPRVSLPPRIAMITKVGCPYCAHAKELLNTRAIQFVEILPDSIRGYVVGAMTGKKTAPQVWIDGEYLGGSEQLQRWVSAYDRGALV